MADIEKVEHLKSLLERVADVVDDIYVEEKKEEELIRSGMKFRGTISGRAYVIIKIRAGYALVNTETWLHNGVIVAYKPTLTVKEFFASVSNEEKFYARMQD